MPRLRVTVGGPLAGVSDWSNTYEFLLSAAIASQAVLQTVVNAIATNVNAAGNYRGALGTDTGTLGIKALHYPTNTGVSNLVAQSTQAVGYGTVAPVHAPQVCVVASLRTNLAGRSYRGRVYVPYRGAGVSAAGVVNPATQTVVANHVQAVVSAVVAALAAQSLTCSWVVWSPSKGTGSPIAAILVGSQCDTIRNRNRNRAEVYASYAPPVTQIQAQSPEDQEFLEALRNHQITGVYDDSGTLGDVLGEVIDVLPAIIP